MNSHLLACAVLCTMPLAASAQTAAKPDADAANAAGTVTISGERSKISLPATPYRITISEFNDVAGQYELQNGARLVVFGNGRHMYAAVGDMPKAELVAASPDVLVAKNKTMKMIFDQTPNGETSKVLLTYLVPRNQNGSGRTMAN